MPITGLSMLVEQLHDIDDRKKAELALEEKEKRYRSLVENSFQGVIVAKDNPIRIVFASRPATEIMGYTREELKDMTSRQIAELIHPDDRKKFFDRFKQRFSGRYTAPRNEYRIRHKTRGVRWVELFSTIIDYEGGPAVQTAVMDITERKRAEEEHRRLERDLRQAQKMEAIGTLAGGIAHDFNNLLQAINGYTQLGLMGKDQSHPDYAGFRAILKAGNRAADLVRQMLLFSTKVEADRKPMDVNKEIEEARKMLVRSIPKMVEIEVHSGSGLWPVLADPVQIEQVLLNLGSNASDAMPDGGKMIIESGNVQVDEEYAGEQFGVKSGRYVLLTVSDTGCGMPKEVIDHIFEPFFTTKEIGKGTGLGLASVYGIVKSHGGFINCYSTVGNGTIFKIYLPAMEADWGPTGFEAGERLPERGTETILLVDDEKPVRDLGAHILKRFGYTVATAASGEEAIAFFTEKFDQVDLVLLDIGMPGMGGHRCLREMLRRDPSAKVLISSGYSINGPIRDSLKAGAAGYVGKPYQMNDLLNKVRSVLDNGA